MCTNDPKQSVIFNCSTVSKYSGTINLATELSRILLTFTKEMVYSHSRNVHGELGEGKPGELQGIYCIALNIHVEGILWSSIFCSADCIEGSKRERQI